jgi:hypothetical protein
MMSCKEVAQMMMSDQLLSEGVWKRLSVRMHLMMCRHCATFARQLERLRASARQLFVEADRADLEDLESRFLHKLQKKQ